jgi:hypothetical protein
MSSEETPTEPPEKASEDDIPPPLTEDERATVRANIETMMKHNRQAITETGRVLAALGKPINFPLLEMSIRMQVLVTGLLGENTDEALRYEHEVHRIFGETVAQLGNSMQAAATRETLLQGVPGLPDALRRAQPGR